MAPGLLGNGEEPEEEEEKTQLEFYIVFLTLSTFFMIGAGFIEKYKPAFGHETGATILLGVIFSVIFWYVNGDAKTEVFRFN